MEDGINHNRNVSEPSSNLIGDLQSSSPLHQEGEQYQASGVSYRLRLLASNAVSTGAIEEMWSCLIVLVAFWFFASVTVILGFYGSSFIQLGPNCSRLIQANPSFVQSIKAREIDSNHGPVLYGFYEPPPLDVEITWSETHNTFIQSTYHKEWQYFLNKGSKVDISYNVKSPSSGPLSLIIAQGSESLLEWIEDPSYPNTTLSWNIIHGNGMIEQEILRSRTYYIALGNFNTKEMEVQLNFTIKALLYNTTRAYYKCFLTHHSCSLKLFVSRANSAVLTSPALEQGTSNYDWYVKLSYGPRWMTYFVGPGVMSILLILIFRIYNMLWILRGYRAGVHAGVMESERTPLLLQKDDDLSSCGSSYDSISHDVEDLDEWFAVASLDGKQLKEGETGNSPRHLCVICFYALRDCFFLPCGHCAVCFACGTRVIEEASTCPICSRTIKKVRKIFTV